MGMMWLLHGPRGLSLSLSLSLSSARCMGHVAAVASGFIKRLSLTGAFDTWLDASAEAALERRTYFNPLTAWAGGRGAGARGVSSQHLERALDAPPACMSVNKLAVSW
jgi:hypothetical protein